MYIISERILLDVMEGTVQTFFLWKIQARYIFSSVQKIGIVCYSKTCDLIILIHVCRTFLTKKKCRKFIKCIDTVDWTPIHHYDWYQCFGACSCLNFFKKRLVIRIFYILNKFMEIIKYTSYSSGTYNKKFITPEILFCSIKMRINAQKGDFGKIIIDAEKNH